MQASVIKISSSLFRFRKNVLPSALTFNSLSTVKDFNEKEIKLFASKRQTPVSLKSLLKTGKGELLNKHSVSVSTGQNTDCSSSKAEDRKIQMQIACFLHHELPVRFAHRSAGLEASPILCKSGQLIYYELFLCTVSHLIVFLSDGAKSNKFIQEFIYSIT